MPWECDALNRRCGARRAFLAYIPPAGRLSEGVIARFGFRYWRWLLGLVVITAVAGGLVYPLPVCACVTSREVVAAFADAPPDAPPPVLEDGFRQRIATWQYTFAMLPPDLRAHCVASELGTAECHVVTHEAPLRAQGLELRFEEDGQGFLAVVHVHPFERWRVGALPGWR